MKDGRTIEHSSVIGYWRDDDVCLSVRLWRCALWLDDRPILQHKRRRQNTAVCERAFTCVGQNAIFVKYHDSVIVCLNHSMWLSETQECRSTYTHSHALGFYSTSA